MHGRHASTAKHLLLRLTDAKAGKPQSSSLPSNMTVEHVLPKKLRAHSQWRDWHPDPEVRERCTDSLGNLVLVTKDQNDKAGNHEFARKLEVYFETRGAPAVSGRRGESIYPPLGRLRDVSLRVAIAVGTSLVECGAAPEMTRAAVEECVRSTIWEPLYRPYRPA
jgi:hypothetical protein